MRAAILTPGRLRPRFRVRFQLMQLIPILLAALVGLSATTVALALPTDPLEPPSVEPPDPFVPWPNGFDWNVPSRFGAYRDGLVDYHWDEATHTYDPAYVNPTSFAIQFDGCASANDEAAKGNLANDYTYTWTMSGATSVPPANHTCQFTATYPTQAAYTVSLDVRPSSGTTTSHFSQQIVVKDWLIVSIGDSYASGEGNPDVPQLRDEFGFVKAGARWEDRRCHRSAYAGAAQAALAIERADQKTSVTFISLACSGATIDRPTYQDDDPKKPQGSGVLGPYRGAEPPAGTGYGVQDWLPSQIDALANTVAGRQIDALIVSVGGNDMGFANVASTCVKNGRCYDAKVPYDFDPTLDEVPLSAVVQRQAALLPIRYDLMASAISNQTPTGRPAIHAAHVFVTEYPDSTRNDNGTFCSDILDDIVGWPLTMTAAESQWAIGAFFQPLNSGIQQSAASHFTPAGELWHYVGNVSDTFAGANAGHGYCASNSWIRRATDSTALQGPVGVVDPLAATNTKGTLHPTIAGHRVYRDRILAAMQPFLVSPAPPPSPLPAPPVFSETVTGISGTNGWITSSGNVLTVTAEASVNNLRIRGASVSVDGTAGCAVAGVSCSTQLVGATATSPGRYIWTFTVATEGIHHLSFSASDANGQVSTYVKELKVDLADPGKPAVQVASPPNAAGWYRLPVDATFASTDSVYGSGGVSIEYHMDGGAASFATPGSPTTFSTDGKHTITYQAVDQAGRRSTLQSLQLNLDTTPPIITFGTPSPAANANGWNKQDVSVPFAASDGTSGSGVSSTTPAAGPLILSTEASGVTAKVVAVDVAGNSNSVTSTPFNIDKTPPQVGVTGVKDGAIYTLGNVPAAGCSTADSLSGVATQAALQVSGGTNNGVGTFTATCAGAQDLAGNSGAASASYTVNYTLRGFLSPVDNPPTVNTGKAGRTYPVKFQVTNASGGFISTISAVSSITPRTTACAAFGSDPADALESEATTSSTGLRYDDAANQFVYNWATPITPGCYTLTVSLDSGQAQTAFFSLS